MKIMITGGTGFIGTQIARNFLKSGWTVTITGRSGQSPLAGMPDFSVIPCDTKTPGDWQEHVSGADIVINLAGKNIFTLWTPDAKKEIVESRILTTKNIADAISDNQKTIFLSTSAAGYFGDRGDAILKEDSEKGEGFLSDLCLEWETAALAAAPKTKKTVLMRFGMILGNGGGALDMMKTPFRMCLGGTMGKGENWVPWLHIEDLITAIRFIIETDEISGPVNFCSPEAVTHRTLIKSVAGALGRPAPFFIPGFIVKALMGGLGSEMLKSQRLSPEALSRAGYSFRYPNLDYALMDLMDPKEEQ